ncbi:stearoyl-CoA 9-desaturase [Planctomycetaceae bacterium SCGC AG-212-F19]|nr:stearoyl-CoA 9-desaturase [Planctomycetaceae bacterium SCGC AG-212-F19]
MHVACLAVIFTGVHTFDVVLCILFYFIRMFGITGGYHRYFAHRAYKTTRFFQFVLAWLGCMALQKGPLWWAGHHRHHHKFSDTDEDLHSPITRGFWWSHVGWVMTDQFDETKWDGIRDFARFPELRLMNTLYWGPGILLGVFCWFAGGYSLVMGSWFDPALADAGFSYARAWSALVVGFFISTVVLYHGVFCVNSLCHVLGTRRYETTDQSKNNWWVALYTMGEGWHNNHHHYQSSANQGFFWWEIDLSFYVIQFLSVFGIVWDVRKPPLKFLDPKTPALAPTELEPGEPGA